jgi:HTH-type transcriptional regulator/antitoxin HigA
MLKVVKNSHQYEEAMERAYMLMQTDIKPDSKGSDELEALSILMTEYESEHYAAPKPNRREANKF